VRQFRSLLAEFGLTAQGGLFPVQTLRLSAAEAVHRHLEEEGIWTVLHQARKNRPAQLSFLLTAAHEPWEIDYAAKTLAQIMQEGGYHEEAAGLYPRAF
jgi:8-amino-7-oxononanoate synthase